jgi:hypothetical protein
VRRRGHSATCESFFDLKTKACHSLCLGHRAAVAPTHVGEERGECEGDQQPLQTPPPALGVWPWHVFALFVLRSYLGSWQDGVRAQPRQPDGGAPRLKHGKDGKDRRDRARVRPPRGGKPRTVACNIRRAREPRPRRAADRGCCRARGRRFDARGFRGRSAMAAARPQQRCPGQGAVRDHKRQGLIADSLSHAARAIAPARRRHTHGLPLSTRKSDGNPADTSATCRTDAAPHTVGPGRFVVSS